MSALTAVLTVAVAVVSNAGHAVGRDPLASEYGRLVFSTLLYRHGDRSIESTYPNDPYADKSYWPMGFGQLTPAGIEKEFALGKWLRERYDGWLPEAYSADDVYVRSSDYDRTIVSADANLAGMYPPAGPEKRPQLIPVHTVPKPQDNLLSMTADCPKYTEEFNKLKDNIEVRQSYAKYKSAFEYIGNHSQLDMDNIEYSTQTLYYSLLIESQFNYALPEWTKNVFPEPLSTISHENFALSTYTNLLKRLKAGPLLKDIVGRMSEKKKGALSPDRKLWVYSAHDTTMVNLLNTMNVYQRTDVPYAALLMFELRLNATGNHVVTISYRNTSSHDPYLLFVPGCGSAACELDELIDVFGPVLPVDWDAECRVLVKHSYLELWVYLVGVIITVIILMLVSYAVAIKIMYFVRRKPNYQTF